jgi:hypothetical protein
VPSVVVPAITNIYLQTVQVLSDTAVTTMAIALSGSYALATSTPVENQIVPPPESGRAFIVSFTFDLKVLSNKHNLFIYVYLPAFNSKYIQNENVSNIISCRQDYGGINFYFVNDLQPVSTVTFTPIAAVVTWNRIIMGCYRAKNSIIVMCFHFQVPRCGRDTFW